MLKIKNTVTEMKNDFDGLISRQDMAEEKISELEDISLDPQKVRSKDTKKNTPKPRTKQNRISKDCGTATKQIAYPQWE